jgi:hypothetical protein
VGGRFWGAPGLGAQNGVTFWVILGCFLKAVLQSTPGLSPVFERRVKIGGPKIGQNLGSGQVHLWLINCMFRAFP